MLFYLVLIVLKIYLINVKGIKLNFYFRHEEYDQYRSLFVTNCKILTDKRLYYNSNQDLKLNNESLLNSNSYFKVACETCNTVVAVYDHEEVYHFFNVAASLP